MSLDLDKVAPQVGEMIGRLRSGLDQRQEVLERALGVMREHSRDVAALRKKIGDSKTTWLVAGLVEGLDGTHAAPLPPPVLP